MHEEILSARQLAFLSKIEGNQFLAEHFYLTGGTALAGFYLGHRYSEDLDFFSENEVDLLALNVFLKDLKKDLGFTSIDYEQSFNRNMFFLSWGSETLKTEFTYFPFPRIEEGLLVQGVRIDSILDIAVNKLFTIYQRTHARDYIDLYCICREKKLEIRSLILKAKVKFDWHVDSLQLGTQFVKAKDALDYPRMVQKIDAEEWRHFFVEEAKKLSPEILV